MYFGGAYPGAYFLEADPLLAFSLTGTVDVEAEVNSPVAYTTLGDIETETEIDGTVLSFEFEGTVDVEQEPSSSHKLVFVIEGTIDVETENFSRTRVIHDNLQGATGALVFRPDFTVPDGIQGPLKVISWKTHRYTNRVGSWECVIDLTEQPINGVPIATLIRRGWHITLIQEKNNPDEDPNYDYLLYQGEVLDRQYVFGDKGAVLKLSGGFRTQHLVDRSTYDGWESVTTIGSEINALVEGTSVIGYPGGAIYPAISETIDIDSTFFRTSRYAAMLRLANYGRLTLRESWDFDRPEFVAMDNPPFSGYRAVNVESFDVDLHRAAPDFGFVLIGSIPEINFRGAGLVNKIVPIGSDEPEGDLTIETADITSMYTTEEGINPDSTPYWYIKDQVSIDTYGLKERHLIRTDIKNPNNDPGTRTAAANTLKAVAEGLLVKSKSEVIEFKSPVANGSQVWALPGDTMRIDYDGIATTEDGDVVPVSLHRLMLVAEREDSSSPSGVREVSFTWMAPEIEIPVPDLPDALIFPSPGSDGGGGDDGNPWEPPDDPGDTTTPDTPGACAPDDCSTDTPSGGTPPGGKPGSYGGTGTGGGGGSGGGLYIPVLVDDGEDDIPPEEHDDTHHDDHHDHGEPAPLFITYTSAVRGSDTQGPTLAFNHNFSTIPSGAYAFYLAMATRNAGGQPAQVPTVGDNFGGVLIASDSVPAPNGSFGGMWVGLYMAPCISGVGVPNITMSTPNNHIFHVSLIRVTVLTPGQMALFAWDEWDTTVNILDADVVRDQIALKGNDTSIAYSATPIPPNSRFVGLPVVENLFVL